MIIFFLDKTERIWNRYTRKIMLTFSLVRINRKRREIQTALNKMKKLIKIIVRYKRALGATGDSWKNSELPEEQLKIVDKQLEMMRKGNPPSVYKVAAEALDAIPGDNNLTLLDVGCASGYYFEVISTLVGNRFDYTGSDYSDAMLTVARKRYLNTNFLKLDIRHIDLPDKAYDVVLSGAVIEHVKEWEEAIRELSRITKFYLILHRTPITDEMYHREEKRIYAGVPVFYNRFNKNDLMNLISECGFRKIFEKNVYSHEKKGLGYMTFVFERFQ